jgi:hypothetical protein
MKKIIETYNARWCVTVGNETLGGLQQRAPADCVTKPLPVAAALAPRRHHRTVSQPPNF